MVDLRSPPARSAVGFGRSVSGRATRLHPEARSARREHGSPTPALRSLPDDSRWAGFGGPGVALRWSSAAETVGAVLCTVAVRRFTVRVAGGARRRRARPPETTAYCS